MPLSAEQLWNISAPWKGRPVGGGGGGVKKLLGVQSLLDTYRTLASGNKPIGANLIRVEQRGTIVGGITALRMLGVQPWASLEEGQIPAVRLLSNDGDPDLVSLVKRVDGSVQDLAQAAEVMRQRVIQNRAQRLAWHAREAAILGPLSHAQNSRALAEKATAGAMATGSAIPTPATPFLLIGGAVTGAIAARSANEAKNAQEDYERAVVNMQREAEILRATAPRSSRPLSLRPQRASRRDELAIQAVSAQQMTQAKYVAYGSAFFSALIVGTILYRRYTRG